MITTWVVVGMICGQLAWAGRGQAYKEECMCVFLASRMSWHVPYVCRLMCALLCACVCVCASTHVCVPVCAHVCVCVCAGAFVCEHACTCPADGGLCAPEPTCLPDTVRCLNGLLPMTTPDGSSQ